LFLLLTDIQLLPEHKVNSEEPLGSSNTLLSDTVMAVAPIPFRRTRPVRIEVHSIPPSLDRATTTTPSGSAPGGHQDGNTAYASAALWRRLSLEDGEPGGAGDERGICVVVEWSKTAGLGKGKDHNVVVRIRLLPGTSVSLSVTIERCTAAY
jgi:hypothetical protein